MRWPHARPLRSHQRGQRGHQESRQKGCVMNTPRREAESRHTNTTPRREVADGRAPVGGGRQSTHLHRAASRGGRWTSAHAARRGRESTHQHHATSRESRWTSAHAARRGRGATYQHHAASRGGRWTSPSGGRPKDDAPTPCHVEERGRDRGPPLNSHRLGVNQRAAMMSKGRIDATPERDADAGAAALPSMPTPGFYPGCGDRGGGARGRDHGPPRSPAGWRYSESGHDVEGPRSGRHDAEGRPPIA